MAWVPSSQSVCRAPHSLGRPAARSATKAGTTVTGMFPHLRFDRMKAQRWTKSICKHQDPPTHKPAGSWSDEALCANKLNWRAWSKQRNITKPTNTVATRDEVAILLIMWTEDQLASFQSATVTFCPDCSSMMDLPINTEKIWCSICNFSCNYSELKQQPVVTKSKPAQTREEWIESLKRGSKGTQTSGDSGRNDAVVTEECPKCGHMEASFYTRQLRSVDEGQTVFYECLKCKNTWSQNN